jgi:hypothetical protein
MRRKHTALAFAVAAVLVGLALKVERYTGEAAGRLEATPIRAPGGTTKF